MDTKLSEQAMHVFFNEIQICNFDHINRQVHAPLNVPKVQINKTSKKKF